MYYTFEGISRDQHFFYTKYCVNMDEVRRIIDRNTKPFVAKTYTVKKRITKVTDELGIVIYQG